MRVRSRLAGSALLASVLLCASVAVAEAQPLERRLALPVSPGAIAWLVAYADRPETVARVREALRSPRADVRATAARVAFVGEMTDLSGDVVAALRTEQDAAAAAELARSAIGLGPPESIDDVVRLAVTRGAGAAAAAAEQAARRLGPDLARLVDAFLDDHGAPRIDLGVPLAIAAASGPARRAEIVALAVSLGAHRPQVLRTFLEFAAAWVDDSLMAPALDHVDDGVRKTVAWWLARRAGQGTLLSPRVLTALDAPASPDSPPTWAAFAREMARRAAGLAPSAASWSELLREPAAASELTWAPALKSVLHPEEVEAYESTRPHGLPSAASRALQDPEGWSVAALRTVDELPPGLVTDLMKVTGCRASSDVSLQGGDVTFTSDGRVATQRMYPDARDPKCQPLVYTLVRLSLARSDDVVMRPRQTLAVPVGRRSLACLAEDRPPRHWMSSDTPAAARLVEAPKKRRHVEPTYPLGPLHARVEGVVALEAEISPTGCVRSLRVVGRVHPELDIEAAQTVIQWEFTPARLDGKPVVVHMGVAVRFEIRR